MPSSWSVSSPVTCPFLYPKCMLFLVSSQIPEHWFYFLLGSSISLVPAFLSGHPRQTLTIASSSLSPLKTETWGISECLFMWQFIVSGVWVSWRERVKHMQWLHLFDHMRLSRRYPAMSYENRDIYWRRYNIQETLYIGQWHLSPLQSRHLGTSHSSPSCHQLPFPIFHQWSEISPFQRRF